MTPLARAEKFLNARLQWLERQLPLDGGASPLWADYVEALHVLTEVRLQLYGRVLGARTEAPAQARVDAVARNRVPPRPPRPPIASP